MKKMKKTAVSVVLFLLTVAMLSSCGARAMKSDNWAPVGNGPMYAMNDHNVANGADKEEFYFNADLKPDAVIPDIVLKENDFISTATMAVSTFSADVDKASYTLLRRLLNSGYSLKDLQGYANVLRTEELVNYFSYSCPSPTDGIFGINATVSTNSYNSQTALLMMTLATEKVEISEKNNIVFLIDVSGSMQSSDKLPLLKKSFRNLTENLGDDDIISIVTYSGNEKVVLSGCSGKDKMRILNAIDSLVASGCTNGEAGLRMAYAEAQKYFIEGGNNRIFIASDGDFNVGMSSVDAIKDYVAEMRTTGIYLSVLGFGYSNFRDDMMESIADNGNGVYMYVDGESEAEKIFGEDLLSNLYTVAEDVKLQITFNPAVVSEYRLVGYENRLLNNEDFTDDTKDAGELGPGHKVTVFYELKLTENRGEEDFGTLAIRYKNPGESESNLQTFTVGHDCFTETPGDDFLFANAVTELSMLIRDSKYKGNASLTHIRSVLADIVTEDFYKKEFIDLMEQLSGN